MTAVAKNEAAKGVIQLSARAICDGTTGQYQLGFFRCRHLEHGPGSGVRKYASFEPVSGTRRTATLAVVR